MSNQAPRTYCWPEHWIEAAVRAGFAHYNGNGERSFINNKLRDMLAEFAASIEENAENAERERCAKVCEETGPELIRWWGYGQANAACMECAAAIRGEGA